MRAFHLFGEPSQRKHIGVHKNHLIYIQEHARIHHIMVETATHTLLREGLLVETNIDIDHYRSSKDVIEALHHQQQPSEEHKTIFVTLQIPKRNRAFITVSPVLQSAVVEYTRQRKIKPPIYYSARA